MKPHTRRSEGARDALDGPQPAISEGGREVLGFGFEVRDERVQPERVGGQRQVRLHQRGRLLGEIAPDLDREPGGFDDAAQLVGSGKVAKTGLVGPR